MTANLATPSIKKQWDYSQEKGPDFIYCPKLTKKNILTVKNIDLQKNVFENRGINIKDLGEQTP